MKILHLTTDEKFIDGAMFTFNKAFPGGNKLLLLKSPANPPIRYIRKSKIDFQVVVGKRALSEIIAEGTGYDWVVVHGMNTTWAKLILSLPKKKILYIVWGAEFYGDRFLNPNSLLGPNTKKIASTIDKSTVIDRLKAIYRKYRYGKGKPIDPELYEKAFNALNYVGLAYKEEFDSYVNRGILREDTQYVKIGYYPMEYFMEGIDLETKLGTGVLIGNSSSFTNNHLEVFSQLKDIGYKGTIMVPLSYGNSKLKNFLCIKGKEIFGDQFEPLTNFMPLRDYTKKLTTCNVMIMNHYRQQAAGNVFSGIYLGFKVFLNPRNTLFTYLKNLGCIVFDIENDLYSGNDLTGLSSSEIKKNKELLKGDIGINSFVKSLQNLVEQ